MEGIPEKDIICIAKAAPSSQQVGFTVQHLQHHPPSPSDPNPNPIPTLRQTQILDAPPPTLSAYFLPFPANLPPYLRLPAEDIHVLLSVKSGAGNAVLVFQTIVEEVLYLAGLKEDGYQVLRTQSHDTLRKFARDVLRVRARKGVRQTVLLLAGDGGVVDLVNGVLTADENGLETKASTFIRPTMILFPLGTGNALFHSVHRSLLHPSLLNPNPSSPSDFILALRSLLFGSPHPLPIFRASFSPLSRLLTDEGRTASPIPQNTLYGSIVASYGLHATLVADSDTAEWRKQGAARFGMVAKQLLSPADGGSPHAYRARVTLRRATRDEVLDRQEHGYVLLTLVSNLEKTFTISPSSQSMDGTLRLVHFGPEGPEEVMRILGLAYQGGKHTGDAKVGYEPVQGTKIEFLEGGEGEEGMEGRWRRVCIDGLIVRVEEGGWMEVQNVPAGEEAFDLVVGRSLQ